MQVHGVFTDLLVAKKIQKGDLPSTDVPFEDWKPELQNHYRQWDNNVTYMKAFAIQGARELALAIATGENIVVSGDLGVGES